MKFVKAQFSSVPIYSLLSSKGCEVQEFEFSHLKKNMLIATNIDVALTLLDLHCSIIGYFSMFHLPSSSTSKKMKYKYDKYHNKIPPF